MEFWLSYNNFEEKILLPVNPGELSITTGNKNTVIDVRDLGELNLIGGSRLAEIEIQSFFPKNWSPYCSTTQLLQPWEYVQIIEKWRLSKRPIRLIVTDTPINYALAIEEFTMGERGGSRDVFYNLLLKEYRFIQIKKVAYQKPVESTIYTATQKVELPASSGVAAKTKATKPKPKPRPRPNPRPHQKFYVWKGEPLLVISRRVYGNSTHWKDIWLANKKAIGPSPNNLIRLKYGQRLIMP